MAPPALYTPVLLAILASVGSAFDVSIATTVNETHCATASNAGEVYQYGAAFLARGDQILAMEYHGKNVTCCHIDTENANITAQDVSETAGIAPCSDLAFCEQPGNCDQHATCVFGAPGAFKCQCTELYEGDGKNCSRKPHWSDWGEFGPYSKSCGNGATHTRTRTCSKPPRCEGSDSDTVTVDLEPCPIPVTTTLPPTRYVVCGTKKCKDCSGGASSCNNDGLDRDKDTSDLKNCPTGYMDHSFKKYDQWWPFADLYLRICASIPPAPVPKYRFQLCGVVNCIGCDRENCTDQDKKHLIGDDELDKIRECPADYSHFEWQEDGEDFLRICRSNTTFV